MSKIITKRTIILFLLPLPALIAVFLTFFDKPFFVFPSKINYEIGPLDDSHVQGNSKVNTLTRTDVIRCEYTLGDGYELPSAGFYFRLSKGINGLDFSRYQYIRIVISSELAKSIKIYLKSLIPGYTNFEQDITFYPQEYELDLSGNQTEYKIPLKAFNALPWWFDKNPRYKTVKIPAPFKNLYNFQFYSGDIPVNVKDTLVIKSISFNKSYTLFYLVLAGCIGLYYFILVYLVLTGKLNDKTVEKPDSIILLPAGTGEITNHADLEIRKITDSFTSNFTDPDFSIWKVREDTGYHNRKISRLIKEKYAISFAQLLNEMRISEAKAMLEKTDLTATEIAFNIGYNNYTHFMREFKKHTGIAAQKYRALNAGKK